MKFASATLFALAAALPAMENPIVGPRALGMGGAQVACAEDYNAQFYNPALFGFFAAGSEERRTDGLGRALDGAGADNNDLARKDWGLGLDAGAGARINGDLATYADQLLEIDPASLDVISDTTATTAARASAVNDLVKISESLGSLDLARDAVTINLSGGTGLRILGFGVGARVHGEALAKIAALDLQNIGFALTGTSNVAETILSATTGTTIPNPTPGYTPTFFTQAQYDDIVASLQAIAAGGITAAQAQAAAEEIDQQAAISGVDRAGADAVLDTLIGDPTNNSDGALAVTQLGSGDINQNGTAVQLTGAAIVEIPFTYGHAFNDHVAVGGSVKYMMGKVSGVQIRVLDSSSTQETADYLEDLTDDAEESSNVGFDLGIAARYDYVQVGLLARNINGPTFKGPVINYTTATGTVLKIKVDDVEVKPDVRLGLAVVPFYQWYAGLTLAADAELLKSESALPGYDHQLVGAGAELKLLSTLDIRGGISKNLAEDDIPYLIHGGLGLNLWLLRADVAGAMSSNSVEVDGDEVPKEARVSFAVATDW